MTNINRRSVLRSTAWSIPAITLAMAAPAYASSSNCPVVKVDKVKSTIKSSCKKVKDGKRWKRVYSYTVSVEVFFKHGRGGIADVSVLVDGVPAVYNAKTKRYEVTLKHNPKTIKVVTTCDSKEVFNGLVGRDC